MDEGAGPKLLDARVVHGVILKREYGAKITGTSKEVKSAQL